MTIRSRLPRPAELIVDQAKVVDYLLAPSHPDIRAGLCAVLGRRGCGWGCCGSWLTWFYLLVSSSTATLKSLDFTVISLASLASLALAGAAIAACIHGYAAGRQNRTLAVQRCACLGARAVRHFG